MAESQDGRTRRPGRRRVLLSTPEGANNIYPLSVRTKKRPWSVAFHGSVAFLVPVHHTRQVVRPASLLPPARRLRADRSRAKRRLTGGLLPFAQSAAFWSPYRRMSNGPERPVVIDRNRWAERESNPHSQRRLIYSQRSSPHCSICPRWVRCIQFYRAEGCCGWSAHNAEGARLHDLDVDDRLSAIHEDRAEPHLVDLDLQPERGPVA
jgi:hypothetical protein